MFYKKEDISNQNLIKFKFNDYNSIWQTYYTNCKIFILKNNDYCYLCFVQSSS